MRSISVSESKPKKIVSGILWMIGCLASFILSAVASRELSDDFSVFQILFFRSVIGLIVILFFFRTFSSELGVIKRLGLHLARNVVHFGAMYCWTLGVVLLPLAEVFALEFTMPIWVTLFATLFLGERITRPRLVALVVSFFGILTILRPGLTIIDPSSAIVLLAAIGFALSIIMVKSLATDCSSSIIVFWMCFLQLPMGFVFAIFFWVTPSFDELPWIAVVGIAGLSAHYTMAQALHNLDATIIIPIDFFRVPLIAIVGFYLYGESAQIWLIAGAMMIFFSNYYALRVEAKE